MRHRCCLILLLGLLGCIGCQSDAAKDKGADDDGDSVSGSDSSGVSGSDCDGVPGSDSDGVSGSDSDGVSGSDSSGVPGSDSDVGDCTDSDGCVDGDTTPCAHFVSPLDLDPTGVAIPDASYLIPEGAIFMSTTGDDANNGAHLDAPVRTLNRAIALAPAGGTIVIRAGVYRDWYHADGGGMYKIVPKSLTFQPYPHEQVWFDGTDVIPASSWTQNGDDTWSMPWSTPQFCNGEYYARPIAEQDTSAANSGPCYHADMSSDPSNPMAGDPQMAFIDGVALRQVATKAEMAGSATAFYYDHTNKVMYLGVDPAGKIVELAVRPVAMVLGGTPTVYVVRGLGFRRYATSQYHSLTGAAIYLGGASENDEPAVIENCVLAHNAGGALSMRARGGIVRHTAMVQNGYTAMGSTGSANKTEEAPDGLLIEGNLVSGNNTELFGTHCNRSCGHAAIKIAHMDGFTVRYNVFENTHGTGGGFWCDLNCKDGVMIYNLVRNNGGSGLFYEVSSDGIIASNVTYNNRRGINVTADNAKIYNNTSFNNHANIYIYDDDRNAANDKGTGPIPDTRNIDIYNNILYGGSTYPLVAQQGPRDAASDPGGLNTGPNEFMTGLDYNSYYRLEDERQVIIVWQDQTLDGTFHNFAELQALHPGLESHGHDVLAPEPDFFVDFAGGDYNVRSDSAAWRSATNLPSEVAQALEVSEADVLNRGAICWPGSR